MLFCPTQVRSRHGKKYKCNLACIHPVVSQICLTLGYVDLVQNYCAQPDGGRALVWSLLLCRNGLVFNKRKGSSPQQVIYQFMHWLCSWSTTSGTLAYGLCELCLYAASKCTHLDCIGYVHPKYAEARCELGYACHALMWIYKSIKRLNQNKEHPQLQTFSQSIKLSPTQHHIQL